MEHIAQLMNQIKIKETEIADIVNEIASTEDLEKLDKLNESLEMLQQENSVLRQNLRSETRTIIQTKDRVSQLITGIPSHEQTIENLDKDLYAPSEDTYDIIDADERRDIEQQIAALYNEKEAWKKELEGLESIYHNIVKDFDVKIARAEAEIELLEEDLTEPGLDSSEIINLNTEINDLRRQVEEWKKQKETFIKDFEKFSDKVKDLFLRIRRAEAEIEKLENDLTESGLDSSETINLNAEINDLRKQIKDWENELDGLIFEFWDKYLGKDNREQPKEKPVSEPEPPTPSSGENPEPNLGPDPEPQPEPPAPGSGENPEPKPGPEPEPQPEPPVPPVPGPGEQPNPKNLPIRSFWEIVASTHTQHVGSFEYAMYKFANTSLSPIKRDTDTADKILGFAPRLVGAVVGTPIKYLLAKPISAIMGTRKKVQEMEENLVDLAENSPEEFAVLTMNAKDANEKMGRKVKDEFETEYLDTVTMKEGKINSAYLDVAGRVFKAKEGEKLEQINETLRILEEQSRNVRERRLDPNNAGIISQLDSEIKVLEAAITKNKAEATAIKDRVDAYHFGTEHRSGKFKEIAGWFMAKRQPDNREVEQELASLSKQRREAAARGEDVTVSVLTGEMRDVFDRETDIRTVGFNKNNIIDRGRLSRDESGIKFANMEEQNKGRLALANIAIFATVTRTLTDIRNMQQAAQANAANSNIRAQVTPADRLGKEIASATQQEAGKEMAAAGGMREYAELVEGGSSNYGNDVPDHIHEATMAANGLDMAETSSYLSKIISRMKKNEAYVNHGDVWDHTGMATAIEQIGNGQAFKSLIEAVKKPIDITISGKMVDYIVDPTTYAALVGSILSTRFQNREKRRKLESKNTETSKENEKNKETPIEEKNTDPEK